MTDASYAKKLIDALRTSNHKLLKENKDLNARIAQLEYHIELLTETFARKYAIYNDEEDEMNPKNVDIVVSTTKDPGAPAGVKSAIAQCKYSN